MLVCAATGLWAQSAPVYGLFLGRELLQIGTFTEPNPSRAAYWECWARGFAPGQLSGGQAVTPGNQSYAVPADSQGAYLSEDFPAAAARDAEFPPGAYSLSVTGANAFSATVSLTESPAAYPAAPSFPPTLMLEGIPAGQDVPLSWQPGADARAEDAVMVALEDANGGFLFNTPWPGQPGALSGLAANATLPGSALTPGNVLELKLIVFRIASSQTLPDGDGLAMAGSATAVSEIVTVSSAPEGNDVAIYELLEGRDFSQLSQAVPVPDTNGPYAFEASAWASAANRLTNATVAPPGLSPMPLGPVGSSGLLWRTNIAFGQEADLSAAFPAGVYSWAFDGTADGLQTASAALAAGAWPQPLTVANWSACQTNSFTNDFVVRWSAPANASTNDYVEFVVLDAAQDEAFRTPNYGAGESPMPGASTQVVIPANTLYDGLDYEAQLRYVQVASTDTQSLPGATGFVGRYAETRLPIGTLLASPLGIATTALPDGAAGSEYMAQVNAWGGRWPLRWSLVQGQLPEGLSLDASGLIQGTPYTNGQFSLDVQVTDALGSTLAQSISLSVTGSLSALAITTATLPDLGDGLYNIRTLGSAGGAPPFHWSIASGQLPPGLSFDPDNGLITGIPQQAGSYPLVFQVQDGSGQAQQQTITLNVPSATNDPVLRITQFGLLPGHGTRLGLNAQPDAVVTMELSQDLQQWQTLFTTNMPANGLLEWTNPPQAGGLFYRACRGVPGPPYNPVSVDVSVDTNSTVQAVLTPAALTMSVTNPAGVVYALEFPTNAVADPTPIQMSVVQRLDGCPIPVQFLCGVTFAPDGLDLLEAATLTVTFPTNLPADTTGFAFEAGGAGFHLYPCAVTNNTMTFPILHFSGVSGLEATAQALQNLLSANTGCGDPSAQESWWAWVSPTLSGDPIAASGALDQRFRDQLEPHLFAAAGDDQRLPSATREFLFWTYLLNRYVLSRLPSDDLIYTDAMEEFYRAAQDVVRAYENGVESCYNRCVSQYRPFQAVRMMKLGKTARDMNLGRFPENPSLAPTSFFSADQMLDRYKRIFRFELQLESELETPAGDYSAAVISDKCLFEAKDFNYDDPQNEQDVSQGGASSLFSQGLLVSRLGQVRPHETVGQLIGVYLHIWPNYPAADPCAAGNTWNDPLAPTIECAFDAIDPVQAIDVLTHSGWKPLPQSVVDDANWWATFQMAHFNKTTSATDGQGNPHPQCVAFSGGDWDYRAGQLFAVANPQPVAGFTETTYVRLFHAPEPALIQEPAWEDP